MAKTVFSIQFIFLCFITWNKTPENGTEGKTAHLPHLKKLCDIRNVMQHSNSVTQSNTHI